MVNHCISHNGTKVNTVAETNTAAVLMHALGLPNRRAMKITPQNRYNSSLK